MTHADVETPAGASVNDAVCLHELMELQADATPDLPALLCGGRRLSYAQLDAEANRIAWRLRQLGVGRGDFVGILANRSELPIIAILACLKAGAAYIPLDPGYPAERVRYIAEEAGLVLCLVDDAQYSRGSVALGDERLVKIEDCLGCKDLPQSRLMREETRVSPCDLAYVIYTSGSTGRPKGVMTEHGHVSRFVLAFNEVCGTATGDRVYQGFSLSFDGSVEEMWMAFSNGSTLVVPTADAPRFGDELGQYLNSLEITYFSTVPTLLATIADPVPSLKTVVLSGEVCPPRLADAWTRRDVQVLNVYGPTEATVNSTVFECVPDQPITIGRPIGGYTVQVVDENLHPVDPGVPGELLIAGDTLARGYLNEPDLTKDKFLLIGGGQDADEGAPQRCYRTGDLARWNAHGNLEFLGRADSQVKIRGYRVELSEIENVLTEHRDIRSASVRLVEQAGLHELAAYVVLEQSVTMLDRGAVLSLLESKVPPYMIPGYLDILPEFPRTISGKVDRNRLSQPVTPLIRVSETVVHPQTEREHIITEVWSSVLGVHVASVADDFFLDLGGHSLVAAQMVTKLRERVGQSVSVRDAYEFPTVQRLAAHLDALVGDTEFTGDSAETTSVGSSREVFDATPRSHRWGTVGTQALSMYALSAPVMIPTAVIFLLALGWIQGAVSTGRLLLLAFVVIPIMSWPILLVVSIAAKWILIGRYKPGEHKLWGGYYLRWWLANRIAALSGAFVLVGTPLLPIYFRLMGARVGPRCTLNTAQCSAWDLVAIGADSSIGADTQILGYRVEGGMLRLGGVEIGNRCFVGIHSALGLDVRMSDGSSLDDQSLLPDGDVIPAGQGRQGSPSRNTVVNLPAECPDARQSSGRRAVFALVHVLATDVMAILMLVPGVAFLLAYWFAFTRGGLVVGTLTMAASVPVGVIVYCLYIAGLKRALLHGIRPGTYSVLSCAYLRKWTSDGLMGMTRALLLPVYTTLYLPPFLRLLGARIGPRAEISTVWSFSPELIDVGPESFFADGAIIGGRRTHLGVFQIEVNRVGRRSFVGNGAVVPVGQSLGDGCLLGVQSIPPAGRPVMPDGTEWLGSPSFALTHRVKVKTFGETTTFRPTRGLYAQRAVIDGLRILIPAYLGLLTVTAAVLTLFVLYRVFGVAVAVAVAPVVGFVLAVAAATFVAGLKKCVMGTYRSEIKPLWCRYVWLNEMINGAYESVFAPAVSSMLGTPFIAPFLRMLGCHIGRRAYIATTLFSEFDLVEVGDYVALNHGVVVQNHLFEDRVFKSSALKIADEASIGNLSVVLYDSEVRRGAIIGPLSLVMKGETIEERTRWHGIPISQINDQATLKRTSVIARSDVKVR